MEVLDAATRHLVAAKSSLIRCGIELQKMPFPMEHGLKLMLMVQTLDRIQQFMQSEAAHADASSAVRAKPKKRTRLQKKQSQSTPAGPAEIGYTPTTVLPAGTGSYSPPPRTAS